VGQVGNLRRVANPPPPTCAKVPGAGGAQASLLRVNVPTFESWLAKGHGRAAVLLEEQDAASYLDALWYACTHNITYDSQCEEERTPYLWRLKDQSSALIIAAASRDQNLAILMEAVQHREKKFNAENAEYRSRPRPTYQDLKSQKFHNSWASQLLQWATTATPEDLKVAGDHFLFDEDADKVLWFLRILHRRTLPGNPTRLLTLADYHRERISRAALFALSHVAHPDVRSRALSLLQFTDRIADGAHLLVSNYELGDFEILEGLLSRSMSDFEFHFLSSGILDIFEKNPTPEAEKSFFLQYEKNPCSNCRKTVVRSLIKLDKLTHWMRHECRYDANAGTVEAVQLATGQH
jgi:hypothetical protein